MTETLGGILTDDYLREKADEDAARLILAATGYRYDYTRARWESVWAPSVNWVDGPAVRAMKSLSPGELWESVRWCEPDPENS